MTCLPEQAHGIPVPSRRPWPRFISNQKNAVMKAALTYFTALLFLVFLCQNGAAQPHLGMSLLTTVSTPVDIANAGDGSNRLFLVEKAGRIRIYNLKIGRAHV